MKMKMKMKLVHFLVILSIIIVATTTAVLDTDGDAIKPSKEYYIYPAITDVAGGLTLAKRNGSCPHSVAQAPRGGGQGLPVIFSPVNPNANTLNLGEDTNIRFAALTTCVQWMLWKLTGPDKFSDRLYVSTGGVRGKPGRETLSNWFKVGKYMGAYKVVFCPAVCDVCRPVLLGIEVQDHFGITVYRS